jgi:uncharacterized membrane protein
MTAPFSGSTNLKSLAVILFMSASLWLALFATALAEEITSFDVDYEIRSDSSVLVTETITYDFGFEYKHGIYRNVKNNHPLPASSWYKERYVDIKLLSVTRDGSPEPFFLEAYDGMSAYIGGAELTITGEHTYIIIYELIGALAESSEGVEFYWNAIGDEWPVPINNIKVTVLSSEGVNLLNRLACYTGPRGSVVSCDRKELQGSISVFEQISLAPGADLTVAQAVDPVDPVVVLEKNIFSSGRIVFMWCLVLFGWLVSSVYRWKYRFRSKATHIVQYEPLQDFGPMLTGVLMDNKLDSRDISAAIVCLAEQGFISIKQIQTKNFLGFTDTDYQLTLLRKINEAKSMFHKTILELLFSTEDKPSKSVKLSRIKKSRTRLTKNSKSISLLNSAIEKDLVSLKYLELNKKQELIRVLPVITGLSPRILRLLFGATILLVIYIEPFIVIHVIAIFLAPLILALKRRTEKGYEALNYLKGFKEFLSVTEKERYKFHNAPALSPQQFMEYLPYAIAFGVDKEWAEVFKDIQIDTPAWYSSSSGEAFSAGVFVSSLGSFSSSFIGATQSSSSGSGGGGSSGGGGGGGGGGSW